MKIKMKLAFTRSIVHGFAAIMMTTIAVAQQSETIPEDLLALDHQRCMNGCVPGFGAATCKPLCDCTVAEFKTRLDFEAYLDMSVQLSKNAIKPEMRKLLDDVAKMCTAEIERQGIEVGSGEETPKPSGK